MLVCILYICTYMYVITPGKKSKNDSNHNFGANNFFLWFWASFGIFFDVLRRFVGVLTSATSCQDADFFPGTSRGHYGPYDILDPMVQGPGVEISSVSTYRLLCLWDFCLSCLGSRGNSLPELLSHYQRKNRCHSENSHFIHKQHQTKQNYMGKMREGQADKQRTHGKINVCWQEKKVDWKHRVI